MTDTLDHIDEAKIGIDEVAQLLSISKASVRNWVKAGRIHGEKNGRNLLFNRSDIMRLQEEISTGTSQRLKSRRNKTTVEGTFIPTEYVIHRETEAVAAKIVEVCSEHVELNHVLLEVALQLLVDRGHVSPAPDLAARSLTERYLDGSLDVGPFAALLDELGGSRTVGDEEAAILRQLSRLPIQLYEGDDLLGLLYMSFANLRVRKNTGSYYTPSSIVKSLVRESLGSRDNLDIPSVIDPCCGSGNFLITAYLELKRGLVEAGYSPQEADAMLREQCIYGYDIDPVAAALARINIALLAEPDSNGSLAFNISQRNSLEGFGTLFESDDAGQYDLVIGNPPWGYSFTAAEVETYKDQFLTAQASLESFCLFIEAGLGLLKDQGILSFVLPESLLGVAIHSVTRQFILEHTQIEQIALLGNPFSHVHSPTITMTLKKTAAVQANHLIKIKGQGRSSESEIPQLRFLENESYIFNVKASNAEQQLIDRMRDLPGAWTLENQCDFALGIVTGNNKEYVTPTQQEGGEPILKGSNVFKYNFYPDNHYIVFKPELFQQVAPEKLYRAPEKLIYRFINENLVFAYDDRQTLSLNSANVIIPRMPGYALKYILAVLNSRAAQFFHTYSFSSVKVLRKHIERLPIPPCDERTQADIVRLVEQLLAATVPSERARLYEEIDAYVMDLYAFSPENRAYMIERLNSPKFLSKE